MRLGNKQAKAQAAVDFLASYGLALVLITIVIVIIYQVAIADRYVFSNSCTPSPGFSCGFYSINSNGILTLQISQATGGPIQAEGIACATEPNATANGPAYGNIGALGAPSFYPASNPFTFPIIQSGSTYTFYTKCYGPYGVIINHSPGASATFFVWLNYTVPGTSIRLEEEIASIEAKYS
ncbi:MAG: hypothetical protein M1611_02520 [Candidatus Marsarchaeota archaeon]|nr:hypothetical protein [Candidatus Marsarchaeota archaeon]